jgi:hypothetical protein
MRDITVRIVVLTALLAVLAVGLTISPASAGGEGDCTECESGFCNPVGVGHRGHSVCEPVGNGLCVVGSPDCIGAA